MRRKIVVVILALFALGVVALAIGYNFLYGDKVRLGDDERLLVIIPENNYEQVFGMITDSLDIENPKILDWVARKKSYPSLIKPGRYLFSGEMSYVDVIDRLRSGDQQPVEVTFNNIRTLNDLAGKVGKQIEADSAEIIAFIEDTSNYAEDGFSRETVITVFIPNTYEMYWNTSAEGFYKRMLQEYHKFWNEERTNKAAAKGLDPIGVSILASIIDDEVVKADEKPRIAGVYLNRLDRGMLLQACPTIKFALNDFTITRVLNKHLIVESPYNTYKYKGLPPGPIGCPTIEGINAVLNAEEHDYIFFAAKADFSGYHNFSKTLSEHNRYADEYQRELDKRKIFD
jgi:UPF0755 protein